jgi:hypothetical protein
MGLIDSIKKIAKIAAPIVGAGIANSLLPGSTFFASALGGGVGSLLTGAKPDEALMTALTAGAGGKLGAKYLGGLGKLGVPLGAAAGAGLSASAQMQQNEMMKKMREAYPDRDDAALQELVLQQIATAPSNYEGYEDMQVQSDLIPLANRAQGGIMDLRAQGGMSLGPGTEKSDDIPAMLSDGEFVMTGKAVRGFGNGSRQAGAKKLYSMMHQAENNATG